MNETYDQHYTESDFNETDLPEGTIEACTFTKCNFSGVSLAKRKFVDCTFDGCDLSGASLNLTWLQDVRFVECKLLGMRFDHCQEYGFKVAFDQCILDHSSFYEVNLTKSNFNKCRMHGVDLGETNASDVSFKECDLAEAMFERTDLRGADLTTAVNYRIDPEENLLKGAKFSVPGVLGLLGKYDIEIEL